MSLVPALPLLRGKPGSSRTKLRIPMWKNIGATGGPDASRDLPADKNLFNRDTNKYTNILIQSGEQSAAVKRGA